MIRNPTTPAGFAFNEALRAFEEAFFSWAPPEEIDRLGEAVCAARDAIGRLGVMAS